MQSMFREPFSGLSHLFAAFAAIAGLCILTVNATLHGDIWHITSFAIFGTSMFLLFMASAMYHLLPVSEQAQKVWKRIDHMMIFVLIAGTYTPFCLVPLRDSVGWILLAVIWGLAFTGILLKIFWIHAPRWLSTLIYIGMGWMILFATSPLSENLNENALLWLIAGGLSYTGGAVIYATKWPNPYPPHFGFHEIWHLFVIGGAFCHFWAIAFHLAIPADI
ncbi:hemolysin [Gammaproteobacteria bacterium 42_54_T18]|nr:hemolysin [Gammaproteobacteria bacterium 42_54_T18]